MNEENQQIAYSIEEAQKLCGIRRTRLYKEIRSGRLKAFKCGTRTLISAQSIKHWIDSLPTLPAQKR